MNHQVIFQNKGLIDMRAVTTMGVSSKDGSSPIGYFGTGLKYAIAVCLRNDMPVTIWRGGDRYDFSVLRAKIRNDEFDIVCMNGQELGFTTQLGKNWEIWQAFRELYCNMLDEKGEAWIGDPVPEEDSTTIMVSGPKMAEQFNGKADIFLSSRPLYSNGKIEIHAGMNAHIFYRGVRTMKLGRATHFTYNIVDSMVLTEDRTFAHSWRPAEMAAMAFFQCTDEDLVLRGLMQSDMYWEAHLNYEECVGHDPSHEFMLVVEHNRKREGFSSSASRAYARSKGTPDIEPMLLTPVQEKMLAKASNFLLGLGVNPAQHRIFATRDLPPDVYGQAKNGTIYLNELAFNQGTKMLAGTLYEECLHIEQGFEDTTRQFQNFLIDKIMTMAEEATGEPL